MSEEMSRGAYCVHHWLFCGLIISEAQGVQEQKCMDIH